MNRRTSSFLRHARLTMGLTALFVLTGGFGTGYVTNGSDTVRGDAPGGSTHATSGTYVIQVGGSFTGSGQASVGSGKVHITATVVDSSGNSGTLKADLTISANHFKGAGTVMGMDMVIEGRADSADQKKNNAGKPNEVQIGPRIVASFKTSDDRAGRVFGRLNNSQQPN
ncbi:MAG TPA: hypothetical protein VGV35_11985 [Bryobacteraceae bacterium]|nr:hypothetical protein [Bryobacteraceae bacterium]